MPPSLYRMIQSPTYYTTSPSPKMGYQMHTQNWLREYDRRYRQAKSNRPTTVFILCYL